MIMRNVSMHILDPATAHFSRGPHGALELKVQDAQFYPRVRVYRSFPLGHKEEFISVRDASLPDLPEIGLISDLRQFPAETQETITSELAKRYFMPLITGVISLKDVRDRIEWDVITTKGKRRFTVRNPFDNIRPLDDDRLLITDIHNCRYEIRALDALPKAVRDILSKYIYL
jgi:hypothetical protein